MNDMNELKARLRALRKSLQDDVDRADNALKLLEVLDTQRSPTLRAPAEAGRARYCPECHALLEESSVYCDNCGTDTPRLGG